MKVVIKCLRLVSELDALRPGAFARTRLVESVDVDKTAPGLGELRRTLTEGMGSVKGDERLMTVVNTKL